MTQLRRRTFLKLGAAAGAGAVIGWPLGDRALASVQVPQTPLPGGSVPQFVTPLPTFVGKRVSSASLQVAIQEFQQHVLPDSIYKNLPALMTREAICGATRSGPPGRSPPRGRPTRE